MKSLLKLILGLNFRFVNVCMSTYMFKVFFVFFIVCDQGNVIQIGLGFEVLFRYWDLEWKAGGVQIKFRLLLEEVIDVRE